MDLGFLDSRLIHTLLGSVALIGGTVALLTVKGSRRHVQGGRVFSWSMVLVALIGLSFMFERFLPLAIVLAAATLYLVPSALLGFHRERRGFVAANVVLMVVAAGIALVSAAQFVRFQGAGPLLMAALFGALFVGDWRMLARRPADRNYWIRRHLVRMIFAFAVAVMALVRIGTDFGLPFAVSVIAPLAVAALAVLYVVRRYPLSDGLLRAGPGTAYDRQGTSAGVRSDA